MPGSPKKNDVVGSSLNAPQREAVEHVDGPILVLAGAGSGKTRVLTTRIVHLVKQHQVRPGRVLAVTFTNKAADETKSRLAATLGNAVDRLTLGTFHSVALRFLRRHPTVLGYRNDFVIYDDQDTTRAIKSIVKECDIDDRRFPANFFRSAIDRLKNDYITPEQYSSSTGDYAEKLIAEVYDRYQRTLLRSNAMDFGDLLLNVVKLLEQDESIRRGYRDRYQYLLVDEFQDTNKVQYLFLRLLAEPQRNLFVVGDDDQSIYSFRGAAIENILGFERDFPEAVVVKLEQNYRSTGTILDAAHAVIEKNTGRKPKKLWTAAGAGDPIHTFVGADEEEEAEFVVSEVLQQKNEHGVSLKDIAVFYRTNAQSRALEESLLDAGVPYRVYGGMRFYERKEVKDILAYLRLLVNPDDDQALLRCVNTPPRGVGAQSLNRVAQIAQVEGCSFWVAANRVADSGKAIKKFVDLIVKFRRSAESDPLSTLVRKVIRESGYVQRLEASKDPTAESRLENLRELEAAALSAELMSASCLDNLKRFLDRVVLTTSDEVVEEHGEEQAAAGETPMLSLMSLHLAKGLEFPVVFVTGLEEGLLPHHRSLPDPVALEEERRLCYVGITRAKERLYLTRARRRGFFSAGGGPETSFFREASRFAFDIPPTLLEHRNTGFLSEFDWEEDEELDLEDSESDWELEYEEERSEESPNAEHAPVQAAWQVADEIVAAQAQAGALLKGEELEIGLNVCHPSFGLGVVKEIEGEITGDPKRFRVIVDFDAFDQTKRLVFKYARLRGLK